MVHFLLKTPFYPPLGGPTFSEMDPPFSGLTINIIKYDLKQICSHWNIGACGTILCTGDGTQDGEVNSADVLHAINYWGTNDTNADHDENGTVDIKDLLLVIHSWGLCG